MLRMFCKGGRSLWVSRATNSRATNGGGGGGDGVCDVL